MYGNLPSKEREKLVTEGYRSLIDLAEELSGHIHGPIKDTALNYLIRLRERDGMRPARILGDSQAYYSQEDIARLREAWKREDHLKLKSEERDANTDKLSKRKMGRRPQKTS